MGLVWIKRRQEKFLESFINPGDIKRMMSRDQVLDSTLFPVSLPSMGGGHRLQAGEKEKVQRLRLTFQGQVLPMSGRRIYGSS